MKRTGISPGVIQPECLYSSQEIKSRTGWGDAALRAARRAGLTTLYLHSKVFFRGADVIAYVSEQAAHEAPSAKRKDSC